MPHFAGPLRAGGAGHGHCDGAGDVGYSSCRARDPCRSDQGTIFEGAFAGQSENGPPAVVGRWEIRTGVPVRQGGAFDIPVQIGDGTRIFGAFGAELSP